MADIVHSNIPQLIGSLDLPREDLFIDYVKENSADKSAEDSL